ncbi:hypothetical protein ACGFZP_21040 [Kitasatospora sp. NPDC048239]|uniref:hypothetical protein n=1 Tax=Kitasatospora sp. NPDC048239 TaxID=3364046 RepID=UPI003714092A
MPEIDGTFLELEASARTETDLQPALSVIRGVLVGLGIAESDLTVELYTDAVAAAR